MQPKFGRNFYLKFDLKLEGLDLRLNVQFKTFRLLSGSRTDIILNGVALCGCCQANPTEMDDRGIVNLKSVIEIYTTVIVKNTFYLSCKLYI